MGERPHDVALCLPDWSETRRRAALGSRAWLDTVVASGLFMEVAMFMDCCHVWSARAVGRPPKSHFVEPHKREEPTRTFLAYTSELQRSVREPLRRDGGGPARGLFSEVLLNGLRGAADDYPTQVVKAWRLRDYLEYHFRNKLELLGFQLRAEVVNEFDSEAVIGEGMRQRAYIMSPKMHWYKYDDSKLQFPHFSKKFVALFERPNASFPPVVTHCRCRCPRGKSRPSWVGWWSCLP